jgi:hypothetical protein
MSKYILQLEVAKIKSFTWVGLRERCRMKSIKAVDKKAGWLKRRMSVVSTVIGFERTGSHANAMADRLVEMEIEG